MMRKNQTHEIQLIQEDKLMLKNEQSERDLASIRAIFNPESNVNYERDLHEHKQLSPRNSRDARRQINVNDEQ
jgi:hypothetical protein